MRPPNRLLWGELSCTACTALAQSRQNLIREVRQKWDEAPVPHVVKTSCEDKRVGAIVEAITLSKKLYAWITELPGKWPLMGTFNSFFWLICTIVTTAVGQI